MSRGLILVVDDNHLNRKLARFILEAEDYSVLAAGDAAEARALLEELSPAAILMDLQLPGMSGLTFVQELRKNPRWRGTWILALSADATEANKAKALTVGCDGYLTKPIDSETLPSVLAQLLTTERSVKSPGEE